MEIWEERAKSRLHDQTRKLGAAGANICGPGGSYIIIWRLRGNKRENNLLNLLLRWLYCTFSILGVLRMVVGISQVLRR